MEPCFREMLEMTLAIGSSKICEKKKQVQSVQILIFHIHKIYFICYITFLNNISSEEIPLLIKNDWLLFNQLHLSLKL